jgi:hypothetical protein
MAAASWAQGGYVVGVSKTAYRKTGHDPDRQPTDSDPSHDELDMAGRRARGIVDDR